jgi:hypothetical protein
MDFIYLLKIKHLESFHVIEYEKQFKIGCTGNPLSRFTGYGGNYGGKEYEMEIIEILSIPSTIKGKFQNSIGEDRLCNYAEAVLHSYYGKYRQQQPTSGQSTEFFINDPFRFPAIDELKQILNDNGINCEISEPLNKDTLNTVGKYNKIKRDNSNREPKSTKPVTKLSDLEIKEEYFNDLLSFIKNEILNHMDLRSIQKELWDVLNQNSDDLGRILNGIIKWPTGTGKRIAIILVILFIFKKYRETGKILRLAVITHRNDICDTAWSEYELLEKLGLRVIKGYEGNFHKCNIPEDESYVLIATHQALTQNCDKGNIKKLDMIIYDEVHHIAGDEMFEYLKDNKPNYLIGISATPKTKDKNQNERIDTLFGEHYISECTYKRAIQEKWINDCEYSIYTYPKNRAPKEKILNIIGNKIEERKGKNLWRKKKIIIWIPSPEDDTNAKELIPIYEECINRLYPNWKVFLDIKDERFKNDNLSEDPWCLLLCQKGKEGYDVKGIEFGISIGNSEIHIYVQEQGRSQRIDYEGQLSEFLIFANYDEDVDDEFSKQEDITNRLTDYMGDDYIGFVGNINEVEISLYEPSSESIRNSERMAQARAELEAAIAEGEELDRREMSEYLKKREDKKKQSKINFETQIKQRDFKAKPIKNQYELAQEENKRLNIQDDDCYRNKKAENLYFQEKPMEYFGNEWNHWYDFLRIPKPTMGKDEFKNNTQGKWNDLNKDPGEFKKWCKANGFPYFDYNGLYDKGINDIMSEGNSKRRG